MNVTSNKSVKSRWKDGVICLVPMFPSWVIVLRLHKKCILCNFVLTSARNIILLKKFTYMHPKGLVLHFQKMVIVYYAMTYCVGEIRVWSQIISLNFCWFTILFDILIANISWKVQTPINHIIFWKSAVRTFTCNM